jgi:hypothetical protein
VYLRRAQKNSAVKESVVQDRIDRHSGDAIAGRVGYNPRAISNRLETKDFNDHSLRPNREGQP